MNKSVRFSPTTSSSSSALASSGGAGILSSLKTMSSKISWSMIGIIVLVIALIIASYFIYKSKIQSMFTSSFKATKEHEYGSGSVKNAELFFFYATWCPHCKTAKPIWEEVKNEYEGKTINGYKVIFTDIDCTNESPDVEKMMNTYKIEGFPTIKLLKDGQQIIEFDAKPTKNNLDKFLNTVL